jgi:phage terminase Nu1 subunit (DNA packaging protein)
MSKDLTWSADRMAKFIDVSPRRLRQLAEEGIVPKAGRARYSPFQVTVSYIRFLRDRVQSPEASDSEFFACKLAKLRAEREQIELQNQITRRERIPVDDVLLANDIVFKAVRQIIKGSKLPIESCNEIFDEMRRVSRLLREKVDAVEAGSDGGLSLS